MMKEKDNREESRGYPMGPEDVLYLEESVLKRRKMWATRFFVVLVACLISVGLLYGAARMIFRVASVSVVGAESYTEEQIRQTAGIDTGSFLFSLPKKQIVERILMSYPYVLSVDIDREYPSKVVIKITEDEAAFYFRLENRYVVFSRSLRVLEVRETQPAGLIPASLPAVTQAICGRELVFLEPVDTEAICRFFDALGSFEKADAIDSVTVTDVRDLRFLLDGRIEVRLGKTTDLSIKLRTVCVVMQSESVADAAAASIDVTDPKQPRAIPYDSNPFFDDAENIVP